MNRKSQVLLNSFAARWANALPTFTGRAPAKELANLRPVITKFEFHIGVILLSALRGAAVLGNLL